MVGVMSFRYKIFCVLFAFIVMSHVCMSTIFTQTNTKRYKKLDMFCFQDVKTVFYTKMISPLYFSVK